MNESREDPEEIIIDFSDVVGVFFFAFFVINIFFAVLHTLADDGKWFKYNCLAFGCLAVWAIIDKLGSIENKLK